MFDFILFIICFIVGFLLLLKFFTLIVDLFLFVLGCISTPGSYFMRLISIASSCIFLYLYMIYKDTLFLLGAFFFISAWLIFFATAFIPSYDETAKKEASEDVRPARAKDYSSSSSWVSKGLFLLGLAWLFGSDHHHDQQYDMSHEAENTESYDHDSENCFDDSSQDYDNFDDGYWGDGDL